MKGGHGADSFGLLYAAGAFVCWGAFPLYFKALEDIPALEVLAHRVAGTGLFTALMLTGLRRWPEVASVFTHPRLLGTLALSACVISVNWGVFIWAIAANRVLEASLGYYINPLVSVLLGVVFLGEQLRTAQWAALGLAAAGVAFAVLAVGTLPWVALTLAFSFGCYGLIRKVVAVDSLPGLFVETVVLAPIALGYLAWLGEAGSGHFATVNAATTALLAAAGLVTALPLLLFVAGARRIRLSTLGLMQYLVPTMHFALAVFAFGEPFGAENLVVFALIWAALAIYTVDSLRGR